jgi:hypothetical protein
MLKMRPTGLSSGAYKDDVDYCVFCGEWCIGGYTRTVAVLRACAGSGRCMPPADAIPCAHQIG